MTVDGAPSLRLGINGAFLHPGRGGMETFVRSLIRGLGSVAPELQIVLYCSRDAGELIRHEDPWTRTSVEFVDTPQPVSPAWRRATRIGSELAWLPVRARRDGIQVLHHPANVGPLIRTVPSVLTVHDLMWQHFPSTHPRSSRAVLRVLTPAALRAAARITTVSNASADDIAQRYDVPRSRIVAIPSGPGKEPGSGKAQAARERFGLGDAHVLLSMGIGFAYKNVDRLLEAFARVGPQRNMVLVHTGISAVEGARWQARARTLGIEEHVRFPGYDGVVTDEDVENLFAAALALIHPSRFEGFGFPPLEAMRRGVPVASSTAAALLEVGGDAVLWFDPLDVGDMASAIERLADEPALRADLSRRGVEQAARFSWPRTASAYAAIYHELAGHATPVMGRAVRDSARSQDE